MPLRRRKVVVDLVPLSKTVNKIIDWRDILRPIHFYMVTCSSRNSKHQHLSLYIKCAPVFIQKINEKGP